jgi:hypothetical protein
MKWFRLWTDILDDVKMLELTDYEYRMFTYLLAYASEVDSSSGELQTTFTSLSLRFRQRFNLFSHAIETFQRLGLITVDEHGFPIITNWSKRQFKSDRVTDRVHKYRASQPEMKRFRNRIETPPDTETDTDTEKKNIKKKGNGIFKPPSIEDVTAYCSERGNSIDPELFIDHYEANGWMRGKNNVKDWKATIRTWEKNTFNKTKQQDLSDLVMK